GVASPREVRNRTPESRRFGLVRSVSISLQGVSDRMKTLLALIVAALAAGLAVAQAGTPTTPLRPGACPTVETRSPNAPEQKPAFVGQTRACAVKSNVAFAVVVLARGLEHPWAVEPLPGGDLLVTEKPGRLRIVSAK